MQNGSKALPEPMQTAQRAVGSAGSETLRWKPQLHLMGFTHLPNPTDPLGAALVFLCPARPRAPHPHVHPKAYDALPPNVILAYEQPTSSEDTQ